MTIKIPYYGIMNIEILQKAIPIKTNLQNAIKECLTQEELLDIWSSNLNENVIEKRLFDNDLTIDVIKHDNRNYLDQCIKYGLGHILIDDGYDIERYCELTMSALR